MAVHPLVDHRHRHQFSAARAEALQAVILGRDLSSLTPEQRVEHYIRVCDQYELDPASMPFHWLRDDEGRLVLYCNKTGAAQLARIHSVSLTDLVIVADRQFVTATMTASTPDGRRISSAGSVSVRGLIGQKAADARMHAVTKAGRRATLLLLGIGLLDESEAVDIEGGSLLEYDGATGEISGDDALRQLTTDEKTITREQYLKYKGLVQALGWNDDEQAVLLKRYGFERPEDITRYSVFTEIAQRLANPDELNAIRSAMLVTAFEQ